MVDLKAIQELLGHSSVKITEIYVHTDEEDKRRAIEKSEQFYRDVINKVPEEKQEENQTQEVVYNQVVNA